LNRVFSIFSQMLALIDRTTFDRSVKEHKGEHHAQVFTCWGQFVAMLFCQLARAHSLREICQGVGCLREAAPHRYVILDRDAKFDAEVVTFFESYGPETQANQRSVSLAKRCGRTLGGELPRGTSGPYHRAQRRSSSPADSTLRQLLPRGPHK
jgi:hypothetical protein